MTILQANNISYSVHGTSILHDISLTVNSGEIVALLGQNGSGKTTFIELLCNMMKCSSGNFDFFRKGGFDGNKRNIGVLWDNPIIFPMLKVKEIIGFTRSIYSISEFPQDVYNFIELGKIKNRFYYQLSKGERKRVSIFLSVLHNPSLLVLDEPTADLDPMIREVIWRNIFKNKNRGVLFTTHLWEEANKYATKIYFIYGGEIISKALSPQKLLEESEYQQKIVVSKELISAEEFDNSAEILVIPDDKFLKIYIKKRNVEILQKVQKHTCNFSIMPVELEDVYQILIKLRK
jgi:ABC-2 type transport system ATP-binding protein